MSDDPWMDAGGPAFPSSVDHGIDGEHYKGMDLRDWFAGQALAGFMANSKCEYSDPGAAKAAYALADAMLAARAALAKAREE